MIDKFIQNPSLVYAVLIGDILLVDWIDCVYILALLSVAAIFFSLFFRVIILFLFSQEIAQLQTKYTRILSFLLNILIAVSVSFSVQAVGLLLAMAMLTIPALTAFECSSSPREMIFYSCGFALVFCVIGFIASIVGDFPVGPTISSTALLGHLVVRGARWYRSIYSRELQSNF